MTIHVASCAWDAPLEELCEAVARAGYEGIEYGLDAFAGREEDLRGLLDKHGLTLAASACGGMFLDPATRDEEMAGVEDTARRLSAFGVHTLEMMCGARPVGGPTEEQVRAYAEGLNEVGRRCQKLGVRIGVHNHCIQFLETEDEIDLLYRHADPELVGVGFDTGHLALAGCDAAGVLDRYADRVVYAHLKDLYQVGKPAGEEERIMGFDEVLALVVASDILTWLVIEDLDGRRLVLGGGPLGHDFFRGHRQLIRGVRCCDITEYQFAEIGGGGLVDFGAVFATLKRVRYRGWVSVELDVSYRPRFESARISRESIRALAGA